MTEKVLFRVAIVLLIVILYSGCSQPVSENRENANEEKDSSGSVKPFGLAPETRALLTSLAPPSEFIRRLKESGAEFNPGFTHRPDLATGYHSMQRKALNLGIYSTDLAYSLAFDRKDEAVGYAGCINGLANDLKGPGPAGSELPVDIASGFKEALKQADLLYAQSIRNLADSNRAGEAVLMATGSFTEALWIAACHGEAAADKTRIMDAIFSQRETHMRLLTILETCSSQPGMTEALDGVRRLKPVWGNFGLGTGQPVAPDKAAELKNLVGGVRASFIQ